MTNGRQLKHTDKRKIKMFNEMPVLQGTNDIRRDHRTLKRAVENITNLRTRSKGKYGAKIKLIIIKLPILTSKIYKKSNLRKACMLKCQTRAKIQKNYLCKFIFTCVSRMKLD